jgi:hypothetical protein
MYMGVKNHHGLPDVAGYADAQRALEVWQSKPRRGKQTVQVLEHGDRSIAFKLYETEVVVWNDDGSVEIDNYGTVTTSAFAHKFLPSGFHLHHPVVRQGSCGGANTIGFKLPDADKGYRRGVCQGGVVRFVQVSDDLWEPDESGCYEITLPFGVDRKEIKGLSERYHLAEFENWLSMAPMHLGDVYHDEFDLEECLHALERREWRQATSFLPAIKENPGFGAANRAKPLDIAMSNPGEYISMASLGKLKLAMWSAEGLIREETHKVWDRKAYDRGMIRARELEQIGLSVGRFGPHQ